MKKTVTIIILFFIFSTITIAQVYQLPNGGFENWDGTGSDDEPTNWNGFPSAECTLFIGCGTATATRHSKSTDIRPGSSGSYSLRLFATSALGIIANGTITTGQIRIGSATATSPENYNITRNTDSQFRQQISAKPDSIVFWAKFVCPSTSQNARMSTVIHDNYSYRDPEGNDANAASHVVGKAVENFTRGNQTWVRHSIPFDYNYPASNQSYILITFSTNVTPGVGSTSDVLYVDDIELIYNTNLDEISVNGNSIESFSPENHDYYFEVECGSINTVNAIASSANASINIVQTSGTNPSVITITNGNQTNEYRVHFSYLSVEYITDEICAGNPYNENGFDIPIQENPGIYSFTTMVYESETCDSMINLSLTVNPVYEPIPLNFMICEDAEYDFYGQILTESGTYYHNLSSINGCDSLITLNLTIGEFYRTYINASICDGDTYTENGFNMSSEGCDTITYTAFNDCDSLVILNLSINPIYDVHFSDSVLTGLAYEGYGFNIPAVADTGYYDYINNSQSTYGCDSIIYLNLYVFSEPAETLPQPDGNFRFSLYPIPATEDIIIKSDSEVSFEVGYIVYDLFGKMTMSGRILNEETLIDIRSLASGIYFINIIYSNKKNIVLKFMVTSGS